MKKRSNTYWRKRSIMMEDEAQKICESEIKRLEKLYKRSYRTIIIELNRLFSELSQGNELTRSDLYRYASYKSTLKAIDEQCGVIGKAQIDMIDAVLGKVFEQTLGYCCEDLGIEPLILRSQSSTLINTLWSGEHFSTRVWNNTNALASSIKEHIEDEMILGKMPDTIKKNIMEEFNVSYRMADRLQRTEAAYVHNTACIESYKQAGVQKVRYLAEVDACEICAPCNRQIYELGQEPQIPQHPNCRCCYIPIVE